MSSPFPGMNPYLELPALWHEFHNRLIVAISDVLTPYLRPKYYVAVETRTYLDDDSPELLVSILDAIVLTTSESASTESAAIRATAQAHANAAQARPKQIQLPMPVEVKERYLEVRSAPIRRSLLLKCYHPRISAEVKGELRMRRSGSGC